jgi:hypothetical protein
VLLLLNRSQFAFELFILHHSFKIIVNATIYLLQLLDLIVGIDKYMCKINVNLILTIIDLIRRKININGNLKIGV